MLTRHSIQNIADLKDRQVFFDANVLIYIFWPSGSYRWERDYSTAFRQLLRQKNELLVDFLVISEIVNRAIRLEYDKYLFANALSRTGLSFKQYRDNEEGQAALSDIHLIVATNILAKFTIIGKSFTKDDIQSFLVIDTLDFTDKGILHICKDNACVLLTNDKDYRTADIDILTANPSILANA